MPVAAGEANGGAGGVPEAGRSTGGGRPGRAERAASDGGSGGRLRKPAPSARARTAGAGRLTWGLRSPDERCRSRGRRTIASGAGYAIRSAPAARRVAPGSPCRRRIASSAGCVIRSAPVARRVASRSRGRRRSAPGPFAPPRRRRSAGEPSPVRRVVEGARTDPGQRPCSDRRRRADSGSSGRRESRRRRTRHPSGPHASPPAPGPATAPPTLPRRNRGGLPTAPVRGSLDTDDSLHPASKDPGTPSRWPPRQPAPAARAASPLGPPRLGRAPSGPPEHSPAPGPSAALPTCRVRKSGCLPTA